MKKNAQHKTGRQHLNAVYWKRICECCMDGCCFWRVGQHRSCASNVMYYMVCDKFKYIYILVEYIDIESSLHSKIQLASDWKDISLPYLVLIGKTRFWKTPFLGEDLFWHGVKFFWIPSKQVLVIIDMWMLLTCYLQNGFVFFWNVSKKSLPSVFKNLYKVKELSNLSKSFSTSSIINKLYTK